MRLTSCAFVFSLAFSVSNLTYAQDTLFLTSGTIYIGEILSTDKGYLEMDINVLGGVREIAWSQVDKVRDFYIPGYLSSFDTDENGRMYRRKVIARPGISKDDLFTAARIWVSKTYKDADVVLDMDDRPAGVLIGRGYSALGPGVKLYESIQIDVKDGKYRYTIRDIIVDVDVHDGIMQLETQHELSSIIDKIYKKNGRMRPISSQRYQYARRLLVMLYDMEKSISQIASIVSSDSDW